LSKLESAPVLKWLLQEDQPAIRYFTLTDLLDRNASDPEVKASFSQISKRGWAFDILNLQGRAGNWDSLRSLYRPKYSATNWRALVLSDLGLTAQNSKIRKMVNLFFKDWLSLPSMTNIFNDEVCVVGNTARMLVRFGFEDDYRVRKLFDRLIEDQKEDGGWHCFKSNKGTIDGWEGMAAFAALPKSKRSRKIRASIERGAEFYLERKLFVEGRDKYAPWFRFHYPIHYYYDILIGLDFLTKLGFGGDKRLKPGSNYDIDLKRIKKFALEEPRKPSKWITLSAMRILKRVEETS
jgi:hypothetical protein